MNKKIYKGLEIMEMISKGKIAEHQKFNLENNNFDGDVEYYNGTLYWLIYDEEWNLKDKKNLFDMFNIQSTMVADFEFVEDNTEETEELDTLNAYKLMESPYMVKLLKEQRYDEFMEHLKQSEVEIANTIMKAEDKIDKLVKAVNELRKEKE